MSSGGRSRFTVCIVGCGNIAGRFDERADESRWPYTHAGAYSSNGAFEIAACVEPDDVRRRDFMRAWGVGSGFRSIDEMLTQTESHFDVVSVCSPTSSHQQQLRLLLDRPPRIVFCEKPVTMSAATTGELVTRFERLHIQFVVNHTRRWDPDVRAFKEFMVGSEWGALQSVTAVYNKGVLNNGSHLIDLLLYLLGPLHCLRAGEPVIDYEEDDPTVAAWLRSDSGIDVHIAHGDARNYAMFEVQFIFERGVVAMEGGGACWRYRRASDSQVFPDYRVLDQGELRSGSYEQAMSRAVEELRLNLEIGTPVSSTGRTALEAQRLCEEIRVQARHPAAQERQ